MKQLLDYFDVEQLRETHSDDGSSLSTVRQENFASTPEETRRGELGQPSIFCSDDDATDSAFKAAQFRQAGYSGNGSGKQHWFPTAWAVWEVGIGSRSIHVCVVTTQ
jgi:hypothetical protein